MTFTIQRLAGGTEALVSGSDEAGTTGTTKVSTVQWDEINGEKAYSQAESSFEGAVDAFFKPLLEAAEKLHDAKGTVARPDDPAAYVVFEEPTEGVRATPGRLVKLNRDSIILRLVEQGDTSRLIWVNSELEILEVLPTTAPDTVNITVNITADEV